MSIEEVTRMKKALDEGFLEYFQQTVGLFLQNYTGDNVKDLFPGFYPLSQQEAAEKKLALTTEISPNYRESGEILGNVILYECGLDSTFSMFRKSNIYKIGISPSKKVWIKIPHCKYSIMPSRMLELDKAIYSALENANKGIKAKPTRFIPSNKDTLINLDAQEVKKTVRNRLEQKGYSYWSENAVIVGKVEDKIQNMVNPLSGIIADQYGMLDFKVDNSPENGITALEQLQKNLQNLELEVLTVITEMKPTKEDEIKEVERSKQILAKVSTTN